MKYYAKFKLKVSDIAEFKTKQERDEWVNFKDKWSVDLEITPENCTFEREALPDNTKIEDLIEPTTKRVIDEDSPNIVWYLRSVV